MKYNLRVLSGAVLLALSGIVINLVLFYVFEMLFKVPLPKGPLERLLGY